MALHNIMYAYFSEFSFLFVIQNPNCLNSESQVNMCTPLLLGVVVADASVVLVRFFSESDHELGDFKYLNVAFITSMSSVCTLGLMWYVLTVHIHISSS